jgi:hypothetical protein
MAGVWITLGVVLVVLGFGIRFKSLRNSLRWRSERDH